MRREVRRILIVVVAAALGFATLIMLRVLAGEPAFREEDRWVVIIGAGLLILLILLTGLSERRRPPRGRGR